MPGPLSSKAIVRFGQERHHDVGEGGRARVEDRDPVLAGVDRVGEDPIERREVRLGVRPDEVLERRPAHPDVLGHGLRVGPGPVV